MSRDKTPEKVEMAKPEALITSVSSLPRTFRAYAQRSTTSDTLQSPGSYTPRTPAYGRTATREVGYSSTLPTPRITSPLSEKLSRSPIGESAVMSRSAELPSIEIKEHSPEKKTETSEESDESDSDDDDDDDDGKKPSVDSQSLPVHVKEKSPGYVISRGTSPLSETPSSARVTSTVSGLAYTPRADAGYLKSTANHEVQTEDADTGRPKRFIGYTGNVPSYGRSSASPNSNRYYGRYTSPARKLSPGPNAPLPEDRKATKDPSPPVSNISKPPIPIGCKEYRKSPLNVDLDDHQTTEFRKRQEEFREAQRRAKRQARKTSSGGSSASPGPAERGATPGSSRRDSLASDKSSSPRSAKTPQTPEPAIVRNASRKKIPSISSMMNSSRSSSCSSSASSASRDKPIKANDKNKVPVSTGGSGNKLSAQSSRKGSTSSESGNRVRQSASRGSSVPGSPPVICRPPSGSKSRSPSLAKSQADRSASPQVVVPPTAAGSRSQSRSPSVNWSLLLKMTRGPLDRSSTSPESLPSKSSSVHPKRVKNASRSPSDNKLISRLPDGGPASVSRSSSGASRALRVGSSGSLPPPVNQANRSGRTTASSSRSHIPSRNASARSIARAVSSSTDSSTSSTGSERVKHSRSASRVKDSVQSSKRSSTERGADDSSFAAKIASSFSWLRRQNSDVAPWWLPSTEDVPALAQEAQEESSTSLSSASKQQEQEATFGRIRRQSSDAAPWWLPSTEDVPGVINRADADAQAPEESSTTSSSSASKEQRPLNNGKIRRQDSEVIPWWLTSTDNVPALASEHDVPAAADSKDDENLNSDASAKRSPSHGRLRKQNSDVVPWWLPSTDDVPATVNKESTPDGADAQEQASVASNAGSKHSPSYGWIRKQNSDVVPWWLPSTEDVPGLEHEHHQAPNDIIAPQDDSSESTSSADETQTSSGVDDESESTDDKQDDTDVEVEDLPDDPFKGNDATHDAIIEETAAEKASSKSDPGDELGHRSSPDGFEWPDCPPTPPMIRSYPFYRRATSPYDNVDPSDFPSAEVKPMSMHTAWGMDALRALDDADAYSNKLRHTQPEDQDIQSDRVKSDGKEDSESSSGEEADESDEESDEGESKDALVINDEKSKELEKDEENDEDSDREESDGDEVEQEADVNAQDTNNQSEAVEKLQETDESSEDEVDDEAVDQGSEGRCSHKLAKDDGKRKCAIRFYCGSNADHCSRCP